jgi:ATP-dependent DNA helicase PIF1
MTLRTKDSYNPNLLSEKNKHPFDDRITFQEEGHKYWIDGDCKDLISSTTFIHSFFNDFDADKVIKDILKSEKYKDPAYEYYNMSHQAIKIQWEENGKKASNQGTIMHANIEHFYNGLEHENTSSEFKQFLDFYNDHRHLKIYRTEWMIFSELLKITGSVDAVFKNEDGSLSIGDWKRSKKINFNSFGNKVGKFPFNHLEDCNFYHYSLQLNLYKIILEKFYNQKVKELFLIILHPNNPDEKYIKIPIEIMEKEANYLLDFRKKMLIDLGYSKNSFDSLKLKYQIDYTKNINEEELLNNNEDEKPITSLLRKNINKPDTTPVLNKKITKNNLSIKQKNAYELILKGFNVFLTGPGGTGKTEFIKLFCKEFGKSKTIGITSTTGTSAILINGTTLHSYLGIKLGKDSADSLYLKIINSSFTLKKWIELEILIIDEISMLDPILFDKLELLARKIRKNEKPFGGIQLILTGDFLQLPCVKSENFCFEAKSWNKCIDEVIYLTEIFRQSDNIFQTCLNEIRIGELSENTIDILNSRKGIKLKNDYGIIPTKLYSLNKDVDNENKKQLDKLLLKDENLEFFEFELDCKLLKPGFKFIDEKIDKLSLISRKLELCIGAQVMLLVNLDLYNNLANGSRGVIIDFDKEDNYPIVRFLTGYEMKIEPYTWIIEENGTKLLNVTQLPLKVSFAISIHKSQGISLDFAEIDLGNIFEYGQAYVALSRIRNLEGLSIKKLDMTKIIAHPKALEFYNSL